MAAPVVTGNTIRFPAGTPASVMNAYYAAYLRNQQIDATRPDPWAATINNFQTQVLNPYLSEWLQEPFKDYRATYATNELMRGQQAQIDATTAALQQRALDAYTQAQTVQQDLGAAAGGLLQQMEPQTTISDTGVTEPYGPYEDPQYTSPGPMFPDFNPYAGSIAPQAVSVAPESVAPPEPMDIYAQGPAPMPPEPERPPPPTDFMPDFRDPGMLTGVPRGGSVDQAIQRDLTPVDVPPETPAPRQGLTGPEALFPEGLPPQLASVLASAQSAAAPAPAAVSPIVPTAPRSRIMQTSTTTPSLAEAMRLLAGIDPAQAGIMLQALEKPNILNALDPLRQEKLSAEIAKILAQTGGIGAATDLAGARTGLVGQQTEALRVKNETIAQASEDYRTGRIGVEEWKIKMAAAHGKFGGGGGPAQSGDTKTFITALTTVRIDPKNAGKSESELRDLAADWLVQQAQLIENGKSQGRALGTFQAGVTKPSQTQIDKHTGYQQASEQLGEISELAPRVRLELITGGWAPWLNEIRTKGATDRFYVIPSIPVPPSMRENLTDAEVKFLQLTKDYADRVLRLRSGAQVSIPEYDRMISFLPTDASTPQAFRVRLDGAFEDLDRWLMAFYRGTKGYGELVPEDDVRRHIARRVLKGAHQPYNGANVDIFLANPKNQADLDAEVAPFMPPSWKPRSR